VVEREKERERERERESRAIGMLEPGNITKSTRRGCMVPDSLPCAKVALSVAVFFVAYFGLITGSTSVAAYGLAIVLASTTVFWFAGVARGVIGAIVAFILYATVASFTIKGQAKN
jgi:hypothetical protein